MKKLCSVLAMLMLAVVAMQAQTQPKSVTITAVTQCATIQASNNSVVGIVTNGTWVGTLTPTIKIYGATPGLAKKVTPIDGTAQATITLGDASPHGYTANIGGFTEFDLCATAWTSGTATVQLYATPAVNVGALGGTGGGGSGTVNAGTINQMAIYAATGTAVSGDALALDNGTTFNYSGTGGFVASGGAGPALFQSEIADPGAPGATNYTFYANNLYHRWMLYNNNVGPKAIGTWMVTSAGGFQIGGASAINGIFTESLVSGNSSGVGVFTENASGVGAFIPTTNSAVTEIAGDNGTNFVLDKGLQFTGAAGAATTLSTSTANAGITIAPNGTGPVTLNAGVAANPSLQWVGFATNTGIWSSAANTLVWQSTGNNVAAFLSTGFGIANTRVFGVSSTNAANGALTLGFSAQGSGAGTQVMALGNGTAADETGLLRSANICRISADVTLSTSATNICSFTLPNVTKVWAVKCNIGWAVTAGTTPTIAFGVNASQTPAGTTNIFGNILTTNANVGTEGSAALSASGAVNVLTSPTLTTSATLFQATLFGTLNASATTGTFAITSTGTGASFAGAVKAGSTCELN
jgi:hypothetical protein